MILPSQEGIIPSACFGAITRPGKICASLPLVGTKCIPVPGVRGGMGVRVCCNVSLFPPHVRCCATVNGRQYCIHPI